MDLNKKLEELKPYQLNCNVFDVYSYNGLTMQDLLCQFFTKINECITVSNETIDLAKWLVNEGLEIEVVKKLMIWLEDGTLENIINVNLFNTLNEKINGLSSQLEHIAIIVNDENDILNNINKNVTFHIGKVIDINKNMTIPQNCRLKFSNNGMLNIKPNIILTINCYIEAGFYNIFNFEDETSKIHTTSINDSLNSSININYDIKVDWFGAKANTNFLIRGHAYTPKFDSTNAFKRAMLFTQQSSIKDVTSEVKKIKSKLILSPNSCYYVKGNNVLGLQDSSFVRVNIDIDGNNSIIIHEVTSNNDSLIDYGYAFYQPHIYNLEVEPYTNLPNNRLGNFFNVNGNEVERIGFVFPKFYNCKIGIGFLNFGYNNIFKIDGKTMCDNGTVEKCMFGTFNTLFNCENSEAVNWKFDKNYIQPTTENSIIFKFNNYSGGFNACDNEFLICKDNERILTTSGSGSLFSYFTLHNNRFETINNIKLCYFDLDFGTVKVNNLNGFGGGMVTPKEGSVNAVIGTEACLKITDSALTIKEFFIKHIDKHASNGQMLELNNVYIEPTGVPQLQFGNSDGVGLTLKQVINEGYKLRDIIVNNINLSKSNFKKYSNSTDSNLYNTIYISRLIKDITNMSRVSSVHKSKTRIPYGVVIDKMILKTEVLTGICDTIKVFIRNTDDWDLPESFSVSVNDEKEIDLLKGSILSNQNDLVDLYIELWKNGEAIEDEVCINNYLIIGYRGLSFRSDFENIEKNFEKIN